MSMTGEQVYRNISILSHCLAAGEGGLNRQINQICLILTSDDLYESNFNQALVISPIDLFTPSSALDFFECLAKEQKVSFLVVTGCDSNTRLQDLCNRYNIPLFNLGLNISPVIIVKNISEYYEEHLKQIDKKLDNDYLELMQLVINGQGIKKITELAAEILGNPLIMTDTSHKLIAYSSSKEVDDQVWQSIVKNGFSPFKIVGELRQLGFERQLHKASSPLFLTSGSFSKYVRRLVTEITVDGKFRALVCVLEYEKPITSFDEKTFKFVASIMALEFAKSDAIEEARGNLAQDLLRDLVRGNIGNETMVQDRIKALDWTLGTCFQVVLVNGMENKFIKPDHFNYIQSIILKDVPLSKLKFSPNRIVILASGNSVNILQKVLPNLENYCKNNSLRIGIGRPCMTLTEIAVSYDEGEKALLLANSIKRSGYIHYYEDLAIYDLLTNVKDKYRIHPGLLKLVENDRSNGTDYFKTLATYLQCNLNLRLTADKLFLHRNTVQYRIKKVGEIMQGQLDNPSTRLQIELGILLLEMM